MVERKSWKSLAAKDAWFHLARIPFSRNRPSRLHTHDFPEAFWIESGEARHEINGGEKKLFPGDLVFVRAADRHRLRAADEAGFHLVNLAFPQALLDDLRRRHPAIGTLHAPSPKAAPLPVRRRLAGTQLRLLREETRRLAATPSERMAAERFLLGLYLMAAPPREAAPTALPEWLEKARTAMEKPEHFAEGVPALVRLCGRSPEHVARLCRRLLGKSPTELVNEIRLAHAARELRLGDPSIVDLSLECGFGNLAHFYRLFREAHGTTPRRYRIECRRMLA